MSLDKASQALSYISSDDRDTWVRCGMGLKSEFGDSAFDTWDAWSRQSDSYNVKSAQAVWRSIKHGGGTTIASLYHEAKQCGWTDSGEFHVATPEEILQSKRARYQKDKQEAAKRHREMAVAADKAEALLRSVTIGEHAYLRSKQFPEEKGLIVQDGSRFKIPDGSLFIPMRDVRMDALAGAQIISWNDELEAFDKKMLYGQRTLGTSLRMGHKGAAVTVLCEGYATGLSLSKAAKMISANVSVLVCFTAGNVATIAGITTGARCVFADNDESKTGEKAAISTGLPWTQSDTVGWDANDMHSNEGIISVAKKLMEVLRDVRG